MDIEFLPNNLDRSHRIRNPKTKTKERPTIVKFARYSLRHNIFKNKILFKGKGVSITRKHHKRSHGKTKRSQRNLRLWERLD